mgnify:CR=1 FL=1
MIQAVIFDLDGVIVSTDECHYQAWRALAEREGIPFSRQDNERLRGVSRMESLDIVLEKADRAYTDHEKQSLAAYKNDLYVALIESISANDLLPGAYNAVTKLRGMGIKTAIGSSSKNAPKILERLGITELFDAIADGNGIKRSKPDPDVFLLAADMLGVAPTQCLVVEDAEAGVEAALNAGMPCLGLGAARRHPGAAISADSLADFDLPAWVAAQNADEV